jgi:hypothetical protein
LNLHGAEVPMDLLRGLPRAANVQWVILKCHACPQTGGGGLLERFGGVLGVVVWAGACPQPLAVREAMHGHR